MDVHADRMARGQDEVARRSRRCESVSRDPDRQRLQRPRVPAAIHRAMGHPADRAGGAGRRDDRVSDNQILHRHVRRRAGAQDADPSAGREARRLDQVGPAIGIGLRGEERRRRRVGEREGFGAGIRAADRDGRIAVARRRRHHRIGDGQRLEFDDVAGRVAGDGLGERGAVGARLRHVELKAAVDARCEGQRAAGRRAARIRAVGLGRLQIEQASRERHGVRGGIAVDRQGAAGQHRRPVDRRALDGQGDHAAVLDRDVVDDGGRRVLCGGDVADVDGPEDIVARRGRVAQQDFHAASLDRGAGLGGAVVDLKRAAALNSGVACGIPGCDLVGRAAGDGRAIRIRHHATPHESAAPSGASVT